MKEVAPGIWQLSGFPKNMINTYLAGDVVIDAGTRWGKGRMLSQLRGRDVRMMALTHCHPDHQGGAAFLCRRFNVPLACHEADAPAMEGRDRMQPTNWIVRLGEHFIAGPSHPVSRVLRDGDMVGDFRVVHTPGHTPGHVIYFRESDRTAIVGDLLANINLVTGRVQVGIPPWFFSVDMQMMRRSVQRFLDLDPKCVCFGHGPHSTDIEAIRRFGTMPVTRIV